MEMCLGYTVSTSKKLHTWIPSATMMVINNCNMTNYTMVSNSVENGKAVNGAPEVVVPYMFQGDAPLWKIVDGPVGGFVARLVLVGGGQGVKVEIVMYNRNDTLGMDVTVEGGDGEGKGVQVQADIAQGEISGIEANFVVTLTYGVKMKKEMPTFEPITSLNTTDTQCCTLKGRVQCPQLTCSICCNTASLHPHPKCGCGAIDGRYVPMCWCMA